MLKILNWIVNNENPNSLASYFRKKRFEYFVRVIKPDPKNHSILDIGGRPQFWIRSGYEGRVDMINIEDQNVRNLPSNIRLIKGDILNIEELLKEKYDIIFSNSTIEHVGGLREQKKLAQIIMNNCSKYFVQTPNLNFPLEPHFLFPFFQFLPYSLKVTIAKYWPFGWYVPKSESAIKDTKMIRLLSKKQLKSLFPDGELVSEKFLIFNKSFYIFRS